MSSIDESNDSGAELYTGVEAFEEFVEEVDFLDFLEPFDFWNGEVYEMAFLVYKDGK